MTVYTVAYSPCRTVVTSRTGFLFLGGGFGARLNVRVGTSSLGVGITLKDGGLLPPVASKEPDTCPYQISEKCTSMSNGIISSEMAFQIAMPFSFHPQE